ncbi:signal recognition particle-docking protein FtsY [Melghirimyces algeriensis]|uniref:Signal recognition particle receptor FtsY n=1 Tax=Melghirimyces algeriensis TaxID=910412 RepID=A0A521BH94_9BACL|nr:signal recognition particle-docking protein FtsY [Melghirimyces algeriensis]SMO46475.1 fused signal recognition particle receptor [Melghirimyces algeriensis]
MSFFQRLKKSVSQTTESVTQKFKSGLSKTSTSLVGAMDTVFRRSKIDEDLYEELEEILIAADVGVNATMEIVERLRTEVKERKVKEPEALKPLLSEILLEILKGEEEEDIGMNTVDDDLSIILFVGVNGVGKTTTIGKLAHYYKEQGKKVVLAAGDTFRAGAIEQLEVWGDRVGVDVIRHQAGSDPAAVIFDGIQAARARGADILICDTAGRLQNKVNLMEELKKVHRVIGREVPGAPHETLLVLDATTGQNAMKQAQIFNEATRVTGIVLTKMDGTAKGGIALAIRRELGVPVKWVGLGEKMDDLQPFDSEQFIHALFVEEVEKEA